MNIVLSNSFADVGTNWPTARIDAWDTLLRGRAIENLSYVIGVNRVGLDGNGVEYNGHSSVISPRGETIFTNEADIPTRADLEQLLSVRDAACVSIYLPTTPEGSGEADRTEFGNLSAEALGQLEAAGADRDSVGELREALGDLAEDGEFWARQAHSLAVFATPSRVRTVQVPQ